MSQFSTTMSSSSKSDSSSIPVLFSRSLDNAIEASKLPAISDEAQEYLRSALTDLHALANRLRALSLFSTNETLEDVATKDLVYMLVPYVRAEVEGRLKTAGPEERMNRLRECENNLQSFMQRLDDYEIIPEEEKRLFSPKSTVSNPENRRENKINQFKKEKEIKAKITALRARKRLPEVDMYSELGLVASLLSRHPKSGDGQGQPDEESDGEDADEENTREITLLVLRSIWVQACTQLGAMAQELDLLRIAPRGDNWGSAAKEAEQGRARGNDDNTWRLDSIQTGGPDGKGALLDPEGKILRPFTILPSTAASERARLQSEVFRPDHRLPTMTIDEYLAEEQQRGNIISGGGPASEKVPTSSEQLTIDAEQDGTLAGDDKTEEKRQKDEEWARYTDANPKGKGNTMNRG